MYAIRSYYVPSSDQTNKFERVAAEWSSAPAPSSMADSRTGLALQPQATHQSQQGRGVPQAVQLHPRADTGVAVQGVLHRLGEVVHRMALQGPLSYNFV